MIRKKTAIFFILLANIILLAHVVVPHHHHKSEVCTVSSHCQNDSEAHKNNSSEHDHDGKNGYEYCVLKQVFAVPQNQIRPEYKFLDSNVTNNYTGGFYAVLSDSYRNSLPLMCVAIDTRNDKPSLYIHFLGACLGLRAPPTV